MKKFILNILFLALYYVPSFCQEVINTPTVQINPSITQLSNIGLDNILSFQMLNQDLNNSVISNQIGSDNGVVINQEKDNTSRKSNQTVTNQIGNSNEINLNQKGSGNLLVNYQVGNTFENESVMKNELLVNEKQSIMSSVPYEINSGLTPGNENKLDILQVGNNNGILAIQEGTNNSFTGEQKGQNNNLYLLQKGINNSVSGYSQGNESETVLFEKVIQVGDNLNLKTTNTSLDRNTGNTYIQTGTNLSIQLSNTQFNAAGGVEVTMTGNNMKVQIDQKSIPYLLK